MIINKTRLVVLSKEEIKAKSMFRQTLGLMFTKRKNLVMIFSRLRVISLHNFFVFYPLEIIVLNDSMKVIEIKKKFLPFTFWKSSAKGKYLIELGLEESKSKCKCGDVLEIK
jgi:uncharacterized membrane protein (UPF0127 family)